MKFLICLIISKGRLVTTCVVVWIEILWNPSALSASRSPPAWWCGLKSVIPSVCRTPCMSPPAWWCGLKSLVCALPPADRSVTTCVVVWIEITMNPTCVNMPGVTTCVVVWIEIAILVILTFWGGSPPAWWCGLKLQLRTMWYEVAWSPPAWWCGLKYVRRAVWSNNP